MSGQHPIEALMKTAMESIREMVDVNTIVGDAVQAPDGTVIIPISKVSFGFAAGGGEYSYTVNDGRVEKTQDDEDENCESGGDYPFAGGSGAGVSISPIAFMVVGNGHIKLLPVNINSTIDKVLDLIPEFMCRLESICKKKIAVKKEADPE
ncbi:MAG: GerW family sporulation protein [Acetivibrionales bacterium]|nr:GerW family sporulation protein [Bacillota bacterium]HOA54979.1 GerW family sporulation protein [Clostridiales bacterium]HQD31519.1 GerW family sporulation protein [Clostridiales bacterium]